MTEVRLRVRSVSELVDAAFALYRRDSGQYIMIMAFATIPQLLLRLMVRPDSSPGFSTIIFSAAVALLSSLTLTVGSAAIMKFGAEVYLGERADLPAAVRIVIPKLWTILTAGFLVSLLFLLGFLVFFVGEFYVAARFFAVTAAIVLEDAGVYEAFSRSSELSSGRKRHILNTLMLVWIIYILLSIGLTVLMGIPGSPVITIIASTAFSIVAYPVVGLTGMLLYYDCRIRGEGFDIEQMAAAMGGPAGATT